MKGIKAKKKNNNNNFAIRNIVPGDNPGLWHTVTYRAVCVWLRRHFSNNDFYKGPPVNELPPAEGKKHSCQNPKRNFLKRNMKMKLESDVLALVLS